MANAIDRQALFEQALDDAGVREPEKTKCRTCYAEEDYRTLSRLLADHRKVLLDTVHKGQKQIDCLDYLSYSIGKEQTGERT